MRYGRDYGGYRDAYDRAYFRAGEGRHVRQRMSGMERPHHPPRPRYGAEYAEARGRGYGPVNPYGGWASSYPGAFSRGLPGATPYQRYGMADAHLWTVPWHSPVPGTGMGYSLPYGMGHGRWL
jgi:hypothetical protein